MQIQKIEITKIKLNPNNPRVIKDDNFKKLVRSIQQFPQMLEIRPLVVNKDWIVLGGNMRLKACIEAGISEVPVIFADNLTDEQQREFIIKDNIGYGDWDFTSLNNDWDLDELDDWGLYVMPDTMDFDLDQFFETNENPIEKPHRLVLQYPEDEFEFVKTELLKHGQTYEQAVYNLITK